MPAAGRRKPEMRLLKFLAFHCLCGVALGCTLVAAILLTDMFGITTLIGQADAWVEALLLLFVFFSVTFGSLVVGTAIMSHKD